MMQKQLLRIILILFISIPGFGCEKEELPEENEIRLENSIQGKIICGYQGWFNAEGDGADLGWKHYKNKGKFEPGMCSIDFWPDLTGFSQDELYPTPFKHADGSVASVFSSAHPKTIGRHFKWMKEYGIDGVFIQRFVSNVKNEKLHANLNQVFNNCFDAAINHDRLIGVMYDLSGCKTEAVRDAKKDWKLLVDKYQINDPQNKNLLTLNGKTVVAIWGVGFNDGREYTLDDIQQLIEFFKNDPDYGNCSVLLGVPNGWRTLNRDCIPDPRIHEIIKMADIVHPWTPGRYRNLDGVNEHKNTYTKNDKAWCDQNGLTYMPVVFPGFSWHNLREGETPLDDIPRLKGDFLWRQFYNAISSNVETIYVAMFDEMDEGTCIFKCTGSPPVGESPFLGYEGLPSDYYLWLTGKATQMLKNEITVSELIPTYPEN